MSRQHGYRIDMARVRNDLAPRKEPYWASLGPGRAIGYRRSAVRDGTWYSRWTEPEAEADSRPKYRLEAVGSEVELDYRTAIEKAQEHFQRCEHDWQHEQRGTPTVKMDTVEDACRAHVENIRAQKGDQAALGAANMYKPVYSHRIAIVRLR